jgi:hypothetical protein
MRGTTKGIVLALPLLTVVAGHVLAEPSHLIYPNAPAVFRYDPDRYEVVTAGDPKFDPSYAIGNLMLWDRVEQRVPLEVYRAPSITAFEPSHTRTNEFVTIGNNVEIVIDGFGPAPRTIGGLCVRFRPEPGTALVEVGIGGGPTYDLTQMLPPLEVMTPLGDGYFADTRQFPLSWTGCAALRVIAFSDKNADRAFEGTPVFTVLVVDATVPVAPTTWGQMKAMYRD